MCNEGVRYLDSFIKESTLVKGVSDLMKVIRPEWEDDEILVMELSGGYINKLVGCRLRQDVDARDMIVVKIYGKNTQSLFDRDAELRTMIALYDAKIGPAVHARFQNGIVYSYVPGEILNLTMIKENKFISLIAGEMVKFHALDYRLAKPSHSLTKNSTIDCQLPIFGLIQKFLDGISEASRILQDIPSLESLRGDVAMMEEHLKQMRIPVVFCHNDIWQNNIVYDPQEEKIRFIDVELASFGYQAYDIATHFCEYAGVSEEPDYSLYPNKTYQYDWLRVYLQHLFRYHNKPISCITDKDVETLYVQVNKCALVAHLFVACYNILEAFNPDKDFNFERYGKARLKEYSRRKEEFLSLELPQ